MAATVPVNVWLGYAVTEKFTFWPGCTLPISASLTDALTCGVLRSLSVMKALLVVVEEEEEEEPDAPPLMYCPTAPLRLAIVPPVGAVKTTAVRLFCPVLLAP